MENEKNYGISTGLCICFCLFLYVLSYASDVLRQFQLLAKNAIGTVYSSIVYIVVYIVDVQFSTKETHDSFVLQRGHCLFDIFYNNLLKQGV